jgi:membrane-associated phospholipid phosphatase
MFNFFETDFDHTSFPSGHTVVAFTTSSVLAATIKNTYASIALYSLAGLTAYQRIYSNNHWFSDTVLAAIIGTVVGNALVKINEDRASEQDIENKFSIHPSINHLDFKFFQ